MGMPARMQRSRMMAWYCGICSAVTSSAFAERIARRSENQ
jgi:hypothetical protein